VVAVGDGIGVMTASIIDTHMHLFYLDRFSYPWLEEEPLLNANHTFPTYWAEASKLGIESAVFMEGDVSDAQMEGEASFATTVAREVRAVVAACRPEREDFWDYAQRVAANPTIRGFRRILHPLPEDWCLQPRFVKNVARLAEIDRHFELCVGRRQLPSALSLARACPNVRFIMDHCGIPEIAKGELAVWREQVRRIAELPNVACKLSGIIAYGPTIGWSIEHFRPVFDHVIQCFGWDRLMWGSDWPVCNRTASLTAWVELTLNLLDGYSWDETERLLRVNARAAYGIKRV